MHRYEKTFIIKIQEKAGYEYEKCNNSRPPVDSAQDLAPPANEDTGTNEFPRTDDCDADAMTEALHDLPL